MFGDLELSLVASCAEAKVPFSPQAALSILLGRTLVAAVQADLTSDDLIARIEAQRSGWEALKGLVGRMTQVAQALRAIDRQVVALAAQVEDPESSLQGMAAMTGTTLIPETDGKVH